MKVRHNSCSLDASSCASIAIICLLLSLSHAAQAQRLSDNIVPSHYSLSFAPDLKAATFTGSETIEVNIKEPTNAITLNAIELTFQNVEIDAHGGGAQNGSVSLDPDKQQATIAFPSTLPAGDATLKIQFTGILNNELRGF